MKKQIKRNPEERSFLNQAQKLLPPGFRIIRHGVFRDVNQQLLAVATAEKVERGKSYFAVRTIYVKASLMSGENWAIKVEM